MENNVLSDEEIFHRIAETVVKRGMTVPAVLFLETMKPLNFIGAQVLVFFGPFLESVFPGEQLYRFTELMEDRKSVDRLLTKIEEFDDRKKAEEKKRKEDLKNKKPLEKRRFSIWRK